MIKIQKPKKLFLAIIFLGLFGLAQSSEAKVINVVNTSGQPSCEAVDVQRVINDTGTVDGDTVLIPARNCIWSTQVKWQNKNITLMGAGGDNTTIVNAITSADQDDAVTILVGTNLVENTSPFRITGIRFECAAVGCNSGAAAIIFIRGHSSGWRIDNNKFIITSPMVSPRFLQINGFGGYNYGLIDNNYIYVGASDHVGFIYTYGNFNESPIPGNGVWQTDTGYGGADFIFLENNTFTTVDNSSSTNGFTDGNRGCKYVIRNNTLINTFTTLHGSSEGATATPHRGCKAYEIYDNTFSMVKPTGQYAPITLRSASGYIFNNVITGDYNNSPTFYCYRANPYYNNAPEAGTHNGIDNAVVLTDTVRIWTTNGYVGYVLSNITDSSACTVTANTATTATCTLSGGTDNDWDAGDEYLIAKTGWCDGDSWFDGNELTNGWKCRDCVGAGTDVGAYPSLQSHQPTYVWNNTFKGTANTGARSVSPYDGVQIRSYAQDPVNYNYVNMSGSFVGASLPTSCTTGQGYWKTNEGEWNSTHAGNDGRLYRCTATDTWTLAYTPYIYPHPLTLSDDYTPPSAPTGVVVE